MKGIVMNILAEMVETQLGLEEWNTVLDEADESGIYTIHQLRFTTMSDSSTWSVFSVNAITSLQAILSLLSGSSCFPLFTSVTRS